MESASLGTGLAEITNEMDKKKDYKKNKKPKMKIDGKIEPKMKNDGKNEKPKMIGVFEMFRFSDWWDQMLMVVGSLCAGVLGATQPVMIIVFGGMIDLLVNSGEFQYYLSDISTFLASVNMTVEDALKDIEKLLKLCPDIAAFYPNGTNNCSRLDLQSPLLEEMKVYATYYCIIGVVVVVCGYIKVCLWVTTAERQSHRICSQCLYSVLRQDIGWFDTNEISELNTLLTVDILKIHDAIGDKMGALIECVLREIFLVVVIGYVQIWKLTLVILAVSPLLVFAVFFKVWADGRMSKNELKVYARAGAVAEEVLFALRTVVAFGGQKKEALRYKKNLSKAKTFGINKGFFNGLSMSFWGLIIFGPCALGFWYGGKLTHDEPENYTVGKIIVVFFSLLALAVAHINASLSLTCFSTARGTAYVIFQLIDMTSKIDNMMVSGMKPESLTGTLTFSNVHFSYPSRPDFKVLNGLNLTVNSGQTIALVGASGCGKSTTIQLLQRFYDPLEGQVLLDGIDLTQLNVRWLRSHIGVVSQKPVLFATTIAENIRCGCENVSQEDIEQAAKIANAQDFIMRLPDKYQTLVGKHGAQLNGGQKQQVAIARALVRNPRILLLDEATSALDTESEKIVQDALDKARQGRTTIIIAHRLSTIKTADVIASFENGVISEQGKHEELMANQGIYYQLVTQQSVSGDLKLESVGTEEANVCDLKQVMSDKDGDIHCNTTKEGEKDKKEEEVKLPPAPFKRLMKMNAPEWPYILCGCIAHIIIGGVQPSFVVILSRILSVFSLPDLEQQEHDILMYSLFLVGLGVMSSVAIFLQSYFFAVSGENLTLRVRYQAFQAMLRQEIAWFDDEDNSIDALTARLATDASQVQEATGIQLGILIMNFVSFGSLLVLAFVYGWQLTLLIIAFLLFILIAFSKKSQIESGVAGSNSKALEQAGKIAREALENICTVVSLGHEVIMHSRFMDQLEMPYRDALKKAHVVGFAFGFYKGIICFVYAAVFVVSAHLIQQNEMKFDDIFLVFGAVVLCAMALLFAISIALDAGESRISAQRIIKLLDKEPLINSDSEEGQKLSNYIAEVVFTDVRFHYPMRPDAKILNGLNISVDQGQTVALVGSSGCGKSTTVQLIERFYDVESGSVTLGGCDVKELNLQWLRTQIGIVSQEPVLFDCSLAENIAYGDYSRNVSMDEIISAARAANIHNFIISLPNGYNTLAGDKRTLLSGGHKQCISIARVLVRNPRVLLLDEATSALDTESEKIVQEALDKAREGRTCIVIAHRLSTIYNADKICVIQHGIVTEEGKHSELMEKQGFYYTLNMTQSGQKLVDEFV